MYTLMKTVKKIKKNYPKIFRLKPAAICLYNSFNALLMMISFIVIWYQGDITIRISSFTIDISRNNVAFLSNISMDISHKKLYTYMKDVTPWWRPEFVAETCRSTFVNQILVQLLGNKLVYIRQLYGGYTMLALYTLVCRITERILNCSQLNLIDFLPLNLCNDTSIIRSITIKHPTVYVDKSILKPRPFSSVTYLNVMGTRRDHIIFTAHKFSIILNALLIRIWELSRMTWGDYYE